MDASLLSVMPRATEQERGLLGCLFLEPPRVNEVLGIVSAEDFFDPDLAKLFRCAHAEYLDTGDVDAVNVCTAMKALGGTLADTSPAALIAQLCSEPSLAAHARHYARVVHEAAAKRRILTAISSNLRAIETMTLGELDASVRSTLEANTQDTQDATEDIFKHVSEAYDNLLRASKTQGIDGVPTGFAHLDKQLGGLRRRELTILAARPSMGKTSLGIAMVANMGIRASRRVMMVSLEMSGRELAERMLCAEAVANSHEIKGGSLEDTTLQRLTMASAQISTAPITIVDTTPLSVEQIAELARHQQKSSGMDCLVVDYLQIISWAGSPAAVRSEQVTRQAEALKSLAKALDIPVVALAQINRQTDTHGDHRPRMSHLRESGGIEQAADNVLMLHRDSYHDKDKKDKGEVTCYIEKARNGPTGEVKMGWDAPSTRFFEPQQ